MRLRHTGQIRLIRRLMTHLLAVHFARPIFDRYNGRNLHDDPNVLLSSSFPHAWYKLKLSLGGVAPRIWSSSIVAKVQPDEASQA